MFAGLPINLVDDGVLHMCDLADEIARIIDDLHWFESDGFLYITGPEEDGVEGPDDEMGDLLWDTFQAMGWESSPYEVADETGARFVPIVLRRFDASIGFYHA